MTPVQYFYYWVSEAIGFEVGGTVKLELSPCGACNDTLLIGGVIVKMGLGASKWYGAAPAEICE